MSMYNPRQGGDPEMVIQQAMRAMAGGRRGEVGRSSQSGGGRPSRFARWTVTQILLLAAISMICAAVSGSLRRAGGSGR
jgi:hypothetical protein